MRRRKEARAGSRRVLNSVQKSCYVGERDPRHKSVREESGSGCSLESFEDCVEGGPWSTARLGRVRFDFMFAQQEHRDLARVLASYGCLGPGKQLGGSTVSRVSGLHHPVVFDYIGTFFVPASQLEPENHWFLAQMEEEPGAGGLSGAPLITEERQPAIKPTPHPTLIRM